MGESRSFQGGKVHGNGTGSHRPRTDGYPSGIGVDCGGRSQDTMFTCPREPGADDSMGEDCAYRGDSDGGAGAIPCAIPERPAIRPTIRAQRTMPTWKSIEDKAASGRKHMRAEDSMCASQKVADLKKRGAHPPDGGEKGLEIARRM